MAVTTYIEHEAWVEALTPKGIGLRTGEDETVIDPRDGREVVRPRLLWLPRSKVRVLDGTLAEGESVVLELPDWLAKDKGIGS